MPGPNAMMLLRRSRHQSVGRCWTWRAVICRRRARDPGLWAGSSMLCATGLRQHRHLRILVPRPRVYQHVLVRCTGQLCDCLAWSHVIGVCNDAGLCAQRVQIGSMDCCCGCGCGAVRRMASVSEHSTCGVLVSYACNTRIARLMRAPWASGLDHPCNRLQLVCSRGLAVGAGHVARALVQACKTVNALRSLLICAGMRQQGCAPNHTCMCAAVAAVCHPLGPTPVGSTLAASSARTSACG